MAARFNISSTAQIRAICVWSAREADSQDSNLVMLANDVLSAARVS
jgi:hypothetical protein